MVDDFLTADALAELYTFSLETTVWNEVKERGYLGAYLRDGYFPNVRCTAGAHPLVRLAHTVPLRSIAVRCAAGWSSSCTSTCPRSLRTSRCKIYGHTNMTPIGAMASTSMQTRHWRACAAQSAALAAALRACALLRGRERVWSVLVCWFARMCRRA